MEYKDYLELLPLEPPAGSIEYCQSKGKLIGDLMIYEAAYVKDPITEKNEKKVKVKCTACGETYYLDYASAGGCSRGYNPAPFGFFNYDLKTNVISGDATMCPECGAEATAKHIQVFYNGYYRMHSCHLMTVHKIDNQPALLTWFMEYTILRDGTKVIKTYPYEAYVYEKRKCFKFKGYESAFYYMHFTDYWRSVARSDDCFGKADFLLPFKKDIFYGTEFENSKIEIFAKVANPHLISYMKLWQKHKNVENLVMQGFSSGINHLISKTGGGMNVRRWSSNIEGIEWSETRPHLMLGLDIEAYRFAKVEHWSMDEIEFYRSHCNTKDWEFLKPENSKRIKSYGTHNISELIKRNLPVMKVLNYIEKQQRLFPENKDLLRINYYCDYIDYCRKLGFDISKPSVLFPKSLQRRHDDVIAQFRFKESAILNQKISERLPYLENFVFEADGLIISPARSHKELIDEGEALNHCVASYSERHSEGKTTIFFIRKETEPDNPFFTLEFNFKNQYVVQNRGNRNCARTDEVKAFEEKWLDFVRKKKKELEKNGKSVNAA